MSVIYELLTTRTREINPCSQLVQYHPVLVEVVLVGVVLVLDQEVRFLLMPAMVGEMTRMRTEEAVSGVTAARKSSKTRANQTAI